MAEKRVMKSYKLPPELVERLGAAAKAAGLSNTAFVERALEEALGGSAAANRAVGDDAGSLTPAPSPRRPAPPRAPAEREPLGLTARERAVAAGAERASAFRRMTQHGLSGD